MFVSVTPHLIIDKLKFNFDYFKRICMNKYETIFADELEDFNNICNDYGINPDEFNLYEHDVIFPQPGTVGTITGKVTISTNDKRKTYNTGNDSSWPSDFSNDLIKGYFD